MRAASALSDPDLSTDAPEEISRPFMIHVWTDLVFLHWPFEPSRIQSLLPPELEVDTFDGAAYVGVIPFHLSVRMPTWLPAITGLSKTFEVNVRTYVRGPDGRRGIWFLSLDASCLPVVLLSRAWYRIPYQWAAVRSERRGDAITYAARRHGPHPDARCSIRLNLGEEDLWPSPRERFLVNRWRLFSPGGQGIMASQIEHPPWSLKRCTPLELDVGLLTRFGLTPEGPPMCAYSKHVEVKWRRRQHIPGGWRQ